MKVLCSLGLASVVLAGGVIACGSAGAGSGDEVLLRAGEATPANVLIGTAPAGGQFQSILNTSVGIPCSCDCVVEGSGGDEHNDFMLGLPDGGASCSANVGHSCQTDANGIGVIRSCEATAGYLPPETCSCECRTESSGGDQLGLVEMTPAPGNYCPSLVGQACGAGGIATYCGS